jgi:16S rRNA processing protein RimM
VGATVYPEGSHEPLTIDQAAPIADGPGWWLHFREVPDRTAADALRETYLEAEVDRTGEPDEVYWHELIGLHVRDAAGRDLGAIDDVYRAGETEVYLVRGGPVGDFDLPAVRAFFRVFEPRRGELVVDAEALGLDVAGR